MILYTAIIGRTDPLQPMPWKIPAFCFTDNPTLQVRGWTSVVVPPSTDPIRTARRLKILAHETVPNEDTIWLDASLTWQCDPLTLARGTAVQALSHPDRKTYQAEGEEILRLKLADPERIQRQVTAYELAGFFPRRLTGTGLLIRRDTPDVRRFNEAWWEAFSTAGHTRDQMSVDYAAWRSDVHITHLTGHYRQNPYVLFHKTRLPHPPHTHL